MKKWRNGHKWLWYFSLIAAAIVLYKISGDLPQVLSSIGWAIGIFSPFIGGFALAFFLYAPTRRLEGLFLRSKARLIRRAARPAAIAIVYLLLLGLLVLLIGLLIPRLIGSLTDLINALPRYITSAKDRLDEFAKPGGMLDRLGLVDQLDGIYAAVLEMVKQIVSTENVLTALKSVISATTSLLDVVIAVMVSLYMLSGREHLVRDLRTVLELFMRPKHLDLLAGYGERISSIFYSYFFGSFVDAMLVGVAASIGLSVFRVPYAVLLGMGTGLLNMIPYFGAITGSAASILVTLLTKNIYAAIGVALYLIVLQQVDGNIVQPRVVGGSVGLKPFYVLLSITVFGGLFGFWGIFLAVPLMAVIQMLVKDAVQRRRARTAASATVSADGGAAAAPETAEEAAPEETGASAE